MYKRPVLAGDIGGTKTTLALYTPNRKLLRETTCLNSQFNSFKEIVTGFFEKEKTLPGRVCLAVAGPVRDNRVRMTNLAWTLDGRDLCSLMQADSVSIVNDLVATTAGICTIAPASLVPVATGRADPKGTIAVLAPGTGLGQAFGIPFNNSLRPFPSEGGHCSFAPRNTQQRALLSFMHNKKKHVSVEQVCSGLAIPDLFSFISLTCPPPGWLTEQLHQQQDKTPLIVKAACSAKTGDIDCETALGTLQLFVDILAAEAANLALKVLATGGVYIGGGMPPRMLPFFDAGSFRRTFCRGVFKKLLGEIPVHIILEQKTALIGAREIAMSGT